MVCVQLVDRVKAEWWSRVAEDIDYALGRGERVVVVTASEIGHTTEVLSRVGVDVVNVEVCNMDITTLQVFLRAPSGVVVLKDGVVVEKRRI